MKKIAIHIFLPILIGIMIYTFWRGIYLVDPAQMVFPMFVNSQPPSWIKFNLPDGLWMYAFQSSFFIIWSQSNTKYFVLWILCSFIMSLFLEILQRMHIMPGTFDWFDILAYSISSIIIVLTKINFKTNILNLKNLNQ
jgi:hypothetical protein